MGRSGGDDRIPLDTWDLDDPFVQIVRRRLPDFRAWAEKQPPEELAERFAEVLAELLLERNVKRRREGFYQDAVRQQWQRSRKNKPKNDPRPLIRKAARELWPKANRLGWTATQFQDALVREGHTIGHEGARRLLTELRKTGTC